MVNQKRRTVLKGISLLATVPAVSLTAFGATANITGATTATQNSQATPVSYSSSQIVKREFTITNLTPNTLTLDKNTPISIPAYNDSSKVKFDMAKARGATIAPGGNITFNAFVTKENMLDVSIDEVVINTDQSNIDHIVSAMNFTAQISII